MNGPNLAVTVALATVVGMAGFWVQVFSVQSLISLRRIEPVWCESKGWSGDSRGNCGRLLARQLNLAGDLRIARPA